MNLPTATLNIQKAEFLAESIAVHRTGVNTPIGKVDPDGGSHVTIGASLELSVATGLFQNT